MLRYTLPNNLLNQSANSAALIRETWMLEMLNARPVNSSVEFSATYEQAGSLFYCLKKETT